MLGIAILGGLSVARADEGKPAAAATAKPVDFDRQVAPILLRRCAGCHNPSEKSGGLNLLSRESAQAGGESGEPAIKPGDVGNSYAVTRIEAGEMPPPEKCKPVPPSELGVLKRWIASGAAWPKGRLLDPLAMTPTFAPGAIGGRSGRRLGRNCRM
jgi:hypothetical protein